MPELPFQQQKRAILVRFDAPTSPEFGKDPTTRSTQDLITYGIINIDKPSGPTSHQVSDYVQKILGIQKAGHAGTLDPRVTGVLPIALDKGTRVVQALLPAGKEYVCIMHLHDDVPEEKIRKVIDEFTGKISQLPPVKSAVKRQVRQRNIYYIDIKEVDGRDVLFVVGCQAGTYIRKLCHDIGRTLGIGAHMADLRRTKAGPFDESTLVTLQNLTDAWHYFKEENNDSYLRKCIQPMETAIAALPKVWILDSTVDTLCHGANLNVPGIAKVEEGIEKDNLVAILSLKGELVSLGIAQIPSKEMLGEKGIAVKTEKVFMEPGVYPKFAKKDQSTTK
ncbi:RNA-guided pseudouridylation complex pseudouridine synthase subunit Cbf5 [Candidatus Woesearchaeota archaeon]|nr:RNA-guided pseudouridylation complex pseudouridine synthase subunit Cbf5 [Candidatus Woesearchaeota archaeon]HIH37977.1 RNA-guided pseudouridylation complex pseudouridine synthase subunit Cbf5 [Candidatus Woesearchaeota archaeon]HIH48150.1 RNA-guided pseudouridylation complex pseudouridine synthase subunit Cbf5 [Candidatus Woesearchaeota archaeon]HIJ03562.1 RNA-guided pseudouridylation complex pseudouridine synthase subunit Cbf5 [Candidatus Woesearchaeota archaeon]